MPCLLTIYFFFCEWAGLIVADHEPDGRGFCISHTSDSGADSSLFYLLKQQLVIDKLKHRTNVPKRDVLTTVFKNICKSCPMEFVERKGHDL